MMLRRKARKSARGARTIVIKVDSLGERGPIFDRIHGVMREGFRTLSKASYSDGLAPFGIWNTYFVVDASEYTAEKRSWLNGRMTELYNSAPGLANGYKIIWEGDEILRSASDFLAARQRFGESTPMEMPPSFGKDASKHGADPGDAVGGLVESVMSGGILPSGRTGGRVVVGATCHVCGSKIDHFGFTARDASEGMRLNLVEQSPSGYDKYMRSIGGQCDRCGEITRIR